MDAALALIVGFASAASRQEGDTCPPLLALLRASQSCELSCRRAADRVRAASLSALLLRQAHERARFSREIDTELSSLGVEPPSGRDSADHLSEPRGTTDEESVTQCISAHALLLEAYRQAHTAALPRDVENVLARQAEAVARGLATLHALLGTPSDVPAAPESGEQLAS